MPTIAHRTTFTNLYCPEIISLVCYFSGSFLMQHPCPFQPMARRLPARPPWAKLPDRSRPCVGRQIFTPHPYIAPKRVMVREHLRPFLRVSTPSDVFKTEDSPKNCDDIPFRLINPIQTSVLSCRFHVVPSFPDVTLQFRRGLFTGGGVMRPERGAL